MREPWRQVVCEKDLVDPVALRNDDAARALHEPDEVVAVSIVVFEPNPHQSLAIVPNGAAARIGVDSSTRAHEL
jgi:hypothetical protein